MKLFSFKGNSAKINTDRFSAVHNYQNPKKRAVLSAFKRKMKGSATIEAAFVMPLFIYGYLAVMQLLWIVAVQLNIHGALYRAGEEMAKMAFFQEQSQGALKAAGMAVFAGGLNHGYLKNAGITGGSAGITLLGSEITEDLQEIDLRAEFIAVNPFDIAGFSSKKYQQVFYFRGWTGLTELNRGENIQNSGTYHMVYITTYGEVFHESKNCAYLDLSVRKVAREDVGKERNASHEKYQACARCCKDGIEEMLYITDYGNAYHNSRNCSGLTRGVIAVPSDEVKNRKKCSKCGG